MTLTKTPDTSVLVKKQILMQRTLRPKVNELVLFIGFATTGTLNAVKNEISDVSNLVKNKITMQ